MAAALHAHSRRAQKPFVRFNAAAIPAELAEAELFGHAKGAFTGAQSAREGFFQSADGSTLFIDEVGELLPALQAKLLRVLQSGEVQRVGHAGAPERVDVRVIAATNRDLGADVKARTLSRRSFLSSRRRHDSRSAASRGAHPTSRRSSKRSRALTRAIRDGTRRRSGRAHRSVSKADSGPGNVRELKEHRRASPRAQHLPMRSRSQLLSISSTDSRASISDGVTPRLWDLRIRCRAASNQFRAPRSSRSNSKRPEKIKRDRAKARRVAPPLIEKLRTSTV